MVICEMNKIDSPLEFVVFPKNLKRQRQEEEEEKHRKK